MTLRSTLMARKVASGDPYECPTCHGTGKMRVVPNDGKIHANWYVRCTTCGGSGRVDKSAFKQPPPEEKWHKPDGAVTPVKQTVLTDIEDIES